MRSRTGIGWLVVAIGVGRRTKPPRPSLTEIVFLLGNVFTLAVGLPLQIYVARTLGADGLGVFSLFDLLGGSPIGAAWLAASCILGLTAVLPSRGSDYAIQPVSASQRGGGRRKAVSSAGCGGGINSGSRKKLCSHFP